MQLISHFKRAVANHPDRAAFVQPDGSAIDYAQAAKAVDVLSSTLFEAGLPVDAKVAIYSPNDALAFLAMLGTIQTGFAWISLNARNTIDENIALIEMSEAAVLFYHSSFEAEAASMKAACPSVTLYVCLDRVDFAGLASKGAGALQPQTAQLGELPDYNDRVCTIFATGGTTGRSRGAVWTNRTWETLVANFWTCAPETTHAVHLCVAPITHAAGVLAIMLMPKAPTNVVMTSAEPSGILKAIEQHRVTHIFLPPTVLYALLSSPQLGSYDTSSLKFFLIAAAPVSPDKLREAIHAFGPVMAQSFGQAEAPFFITYLSPEDHARAFESPEHGKLLQSCGRPTMFTEVEIMDDGGTLLPTGQAGEIVARGNLVMQGYYKNLEATKDVSAFGWHHTGDIGVKDDEGYFYIVDRKRDMIISGGFNVFSTEVESALLSHPDVLDCAVIGVPDQKWGEAVTGVVELKPGATVSGDELVAHCKARIGSVKAPKTIEFWDTLPRSAVGKVLKRAVRDRLWSGQQRAV